MDDLTQKLIGAAETGTKIVFAAGTKRVVFDGSKVETKADAREAIDRLYSELAPELPSLN